MAKLVINYKEVEEADNIVLTKDTLRKRICYMKPQLRNIDLNVSVTGGFYPGKECENGGNVDCS